MRGGCPRNCRGWLHMWCGHAKPWTRVPITMDAYLHYRLARQQAEVNELWEEFGREVVRKGLFEGIEVSFPKVVEEGIALDGEDGM